jgi:immune inhibitor A
MEPEDGCMGVFAHELGHMLGLPDLYDTTNRSYGAGVWCLIAGGSWGDRGAKPSHLCAWSKARLGWVEPHNISYASPIRVEPIESESHCYRLWTSGDAGNEYFLIENRQRQGFDVSLPGQGLLIWHIDDAQLANDDPRHYWVALEQADGKRDLERGQNAGDPGDPYPGTTVQALFDNDTKPNSRDYFGDSTGVCVSGIEQGENYIDCNIAV